MAALEAGIEWLRPLANNQPWDYCIIWKLGDDPSSGGRRTEVGIKIKGEDFLECKDATVKHPVRSDACKKLAQLPSAIPLYSGIHGDVVISKRPRWTTQYTNDEPSGTQVLIPLTWGLIELFSRKNVPRDEKMIDFISTRFQVPFKQESIIKNQENWPPSSSLQYLNLPQQPINYSSFEGSSTCSSLSDELQLLQLGRDHVLTGISLEQSSIHYADSPSRNLRLKRKKCADFAFTNCNEKVGMKLRHKSGKGPFKSKNLMTERNRRKRIKDGELALRALVPKITKMDKTATLMDAADYIKELLETVRNYRDELEALEEGDSKESNIKPEHETVKDKMGSEKTPIVVEVEVNQLGMKDFLLKIICKQKRGAFTRLIQVIDSLGLQVEDANVTTLHGLVSNVLKVEAMRADLDPTTLKHSLVHLVT